MYKNLKKIAAVALASMLLLSFTACKGGNDSSEIDRTNSINSANSNVVDGNASVTSSEDNQSTVSNTSSKQDAATSSNKNSSTGSTTNSKTSSTTSTNKDTKPAALSELRGSTVTVFSWNEPSAVPTATSVINKFKKETGINVKWVTASYDDYATELANLIASDKSPDIVRLRALNVGVTKHLDPLTVSGNDFSDKIWDQTLMDYYTVNGKPFATNRANTLLQLPRVMHYNKGYITRYSLEDPYELWKKGKWTWKKALQLVDDYQEATGKKQPAWTAITTDYAYALGAPVVNYKDGKFSSNVGSGKLLTGMQTMADWIGKGKISQTVWDMSGFTAGNYLFMSESIIGARKTHFYFTDMKASNKLACVPFPKVDGQSKYYQVMHEYEAYGIAKGAKNPKAVPYFLSYYLDGDNYDAKTFFANAQILDVYKSCMKQKNLIIADNDDYVIKSAYIGGSSLLAQLNATSASQTKSFLDSQEGVIKNAVKQYNAEVAKMK